MIVRGGGVVVAQSPSQDSGGGSTPTPPLLIPARSLVVAPCERKEVRDFIETHHYSRSINGVVSSHCFKVTHGTELVGAVLFGPMASTAWRHYVSREYELLELRRLVLLDQVGPNSESRVIGWCLRWIRKNLPGVKRILSYADPLHQHTGVIYRAANFKYVGRSGKDIRYLDPETGKTYHSRALKTKYTAGSFKGEFKPFVKRLREKKDKGLLIKVVIPPKHVFVYDFSKET